MANGDLERAILNRVETEVATIKSTFNDELYKRTLESRQRFEESVDSMEKRMARDLRLTIFSIVLAAVSTAAGAMLFGSFTATKEVNSAVIALQKDIMAAQGTIRGADKELSEARVRLTGITSEVSTLIQQTKEAKSSLDQNREQLQAKINELTSFQKPENLGNVFFAAQEACPEKFELKGLVALVTDKWNDQTSPYKYLTDFTGSTAYQLRRVYLCIRK